MKRRLLLLLALTLCAFGQQKQPPAAPDPRQLLLKLAGEYTTVTKFTPPPTMTVETTGTAKIAAILDDHFILESNEGRGAHSYKGLRMYGYHEGPKEYEGLWVYTGSTAMMHLHGRGTGDGRTIQFAATFADETGRIQFAQVWFRVIDDDHFTVELLAGTGPNAPREFTTYTRVK